MPLAMRRAFPKRAARDERLHLHEYRPRAFDAAQHRGARLADRSLGKEHLRRVRHLAQAGARHLEHAKLARRAEPVLERAHHAVRMMALALEIEHGIHDVLERLRTGEIPVLRDVPDEHDRHVPALRCEEQVRRNFAHLADAAGRRLKTDGEDRLNRIDDHERGLEPLDLLQDALEARFGEEVQRRTVHREPLAAELDLVLRLLPEL